MSEFTAELVLLPKDFVDLEELLKKIGPGLSVLIRQSEIKVDDMPFVLTLGLTKVDSNYFAKYGILTTT